MVTFNSKWVHWTPTICNVSQVGADKTDEINSVSSVSAILSPSGEVSEADEHPGHVLGDMESAFMYLWALLDAHGREVPPATDDLIARCVNRMQGWVHCWDECRRGNIEKLREDFHWSYPSLLHNKEKGFYNRDKLPLLIGARRATRAKRLSPDGRIVEDESLPPYDDGLPPF